MEDEDAERKELKELFGCRAQEWKGFDPEIGEELWPRTLTEKIRREDFRLRDRRDEGPFGSGVYRRCGLG